MGGLKISGPEYYGILECGGLGRLKKFCLLSHRKIEEVIALSGEEIYDAIKELTGAKIYEEKKEESIRVLEKTSALKSRGAKARERTPPRTSRQTRNAARQQARV